MANETPQEQSGGINIDDSDVTVGGDMVGRDKITHSEALDAERLAQRFAAIYEKIDKRPQDPDVDKSEVKQTVKQIEAEVKKGEDANAAKVERWLKFLALMTDDIFQVTAATLAHPIAGVAKTIQLIAKRAKEEAA